MIDFSLSPETENTRTMIHMMAESTMRPIAREYDEREHEKPMEWLNMMWNASKGLISLGDGEKSRPKASGNHPSGSCAPPSSSKNSRGETQGCISASRIPVLAAQR